MRKSAVLLIALGVAGCGGSSAGPDRSQIQHRPTTSAPKGLLLVAGDYDTDVSLTSSTCQGVTVQPNTTTVEHIAGATTLKLTHAGTTYDGLVAVGGRFFTKARPVGKAADFSIVSIEGQFATKGFDATVTVKMSNKKCEYVVHWVGTKQGEANVLG